MPQSQVRLELPSDSIRLLPEGAAYTAASGQARLEVRRATPAAGAPERILVYATCDSLQLACEQWEQQVLRLSHSLQDARAESDSLSSLVASERKASVTVGFPLGVVTGFMAGLLAMALLLFMARRNPP